MKVESSSKKANGKKKQNDRSALESSEVEVKHAKEFNSSVTQRSLLDDSSSSEGGNQVYITYRSCVPAVNEERLSVLGFEVSSLYLSICLLCQCFDYCSMLYFYLLSLGLYNI